MFDEEGNSIVWTSMGWFAAVVAYMAGITYLLVSVL